MSEPQQEFDDLSLLEKLRGLCLLQQELTRLALYLASEGPIEFEGETFSCSLRDGQRKTSTLLAMTAGQSLNTILNFAKLQGIQVRDCYPVARSAVESFINAAYLLSETDAVTERAIKYIQFAHWKHHNRRFGSGEFAIEIRTDPSPDETLARKFPEFAGKGKESWTTLDTPSRVRRVGQLSGRKAGARLLAAYGLIYSLSSEIIHGSPFGASYFYSAFLDKEMTTDAFVKGTVRQIEEILIAVLHAGCGYLSAFFEAQNMKALIAAEQRLFDKLLEVSNFGVNERHA
jgi:uncharacterized protein DUF5677